MGAHQTMTYYYIGTRHGREVATMTGNHPDNIHARLEAARIITARDDIDTLQVRDRQGTVIQTLTR